MGEKNLQGFKVMIGEEEYIIQYTVVNVHIYTYIYKSRVGINYHYKNFGVKDFSREVEQKRNKVIYK